MVEGGGVAKTEAEIPYSIVEYSAIFEHPIIKALSENRASLIAAVLEALGRWGFKLDGVEIKTQAEKLTEQGIIFRRTTPASPARHLAVSFGRIFISAENLDWAEADDFISGMTTGINAVYGATHAVIQSQQLIVGMHIQLKNRLRKDVTASLLSSTGLSLLDGEPQFTGVILNNEKSSLLLDASAAYANGLFVRISRQYSADTSWQQLSETFRRDEERLFQLLGLEGVL